MSANGMTTGEVLPSLIRILCYSGRINNMHEWHGATLQLHLLYTSRMRNGES